VTRQLLALALTLIIELPCAYPFGARISREREEPRWRWPVIILSASLLTHPFAWWANEVGLIALPFWQRAAIIEVSVVILEAILYRFALPLQAKRAIGASLLANSASFGFGLLLYALGVAI
jgi:hypothetical protein